MPKINQKQGQPATNSAARARRIAADSRVFAAALSGLKKSGRASKTK